MDKHIEFKNTLATNLSTSIKNNVFFMRAREHNSTLEASLFNNNIPVDVFHNQINTFKKNLPVWHRYFDIRRKALKLKEVNYYDMWTPITKKKPKISFEKAVDLISESLATLGREYVDTLRKDVFRNAGWISIPTREKPMAHFHTARRAPIHSS